MKSLRLDNFSGGLADSIWAGVKGSFAAGSKCLDIHGTPGIAQAQYKLTKDSGATITGLPLWSFVATDGKTYWFDDAGGCYCRTAGGTWSLDKSFGVKVCGAAEYNGYLYVATSDTLYRVVKATGTYALASLASWQTWTGAEIDTSFHPMLVGEDGTLYIGAGQYISSVNVAGAWNSQALDLPVNWAIRCLAYAGQMLLIGANYGATNCNLCAIYRWDGLSDSFFDPCYIYASSVNAMASDGNFVMFQAGNRGKLYQYLGGTQKAEVKEIPGTYAPTALMELYPDALVMKDSYAHIGVSNSTGNPCSQGVYTWGSKHKNYPKVLNFEYVISPDKVASISIGSILVEGDNLLVSWKDGATYGVDKVDYTTRYASAAYCSTVLGNGRPLITFKRFILNFEPLPASTSLTLSYQADRVGSWTTISNQSGVFNTAAGTAVAFDETIIAGFLELKVAFGTATTNTPKLKSIEILYEQSDRY